MILKIPVNVWHNQGMQLNIDSSGFISSYALNISEWNCFLGCPKLYSETHKHQKKLGSYYATAQKKKKAPKKVSDVTKIETLVSTLNPLGLGRTARDPDVASFSL